MTVWRHDWMEVLERSLDKDLSKTCMLCRYMEWFWFFNAGFPLPLYCTVILQIIDHHSPTKFPAKSLRKYGSFLLICLLDDLSRLTVTPEIGPSSLKVTGGEGVVLCGCCCYILHIITLFFFFLDYHLCLFKTMEKIRLASNSPPSFNFNGRIFSISIFSISNTRFWNKFIYSDAKNGKFGWNAYVKASMDRLLHK